MRYYTKKALQSLGAIVKIQTTASCICHVKIEMTSVSQDHPICFEMVQTLWPVVYM